MARHTTPDRLDAEARSGARPPARPPDTKRRILTTAIRLFNELGSGQVSTVRIARELGISPGNLYYHYRNKQDIIRAIFREIMDHHEIRLAKQALRLDPTPQALAFYLQQNLLMLDEYRFFFRELPVLLHQDPVLLEAFQASRRERVQENVEIIEAMIDRGLMLPLERREREQLAELLLFCNMFLPAWIQPGGRLRQEDCRQIIDIMLLVMRRFTPRDVAEALAAPT